MLKENIYCSISLFRWGKEVDPESRNFKPINSASGAKAAGVGREEGYTASCQMAVPGMQHVERLRSSVRGSEIAELSEHAGHVSNTLQFQGPLQGYAVLSMPRLCCQRFPICRGNYISQFMQAGCLDAPLRKWEYCSVQRPKRIVCLTCVLFAAFLC